MPFTSDDVEKNREWFEAKLRAEKQKAAVVSWVEGKSAADFLLLDSRGREPFAAGHIQGAICLPLDEVVALAGRLPKDRELVAYCWNDT